DGGGSAQIGEVTVLGEQQGGRARSGVEQQKQTIAGRETALAVLVPPGRQFEHDVARAFHVGTLHVDLGAQVIELRYQRIRERRLTETERAKAALDGGDCDAQRDLVAKRFERDDFHERTGKGKRERET